MEQLIIRPQTQRDCRELVHLENEIFECDIVKLRSFQRFVTTSTVDSFVAELDTRLVGYATNFYRGGTRIARIYSIAVHPSCRRIGLGNKLLRVCEEAATERGSSFLRLEVKIDNPNAIAFYERHGYAQYGLRPRYYEDGTDALLMRKELAN